MLKTEFMAELKARLQGVPEEDIQKSLAYYGEMIDDGVEDGVGEEEAVAALGNIDEIVAQIVSDTPITKLVKEKVRTGRKPRAWEIILLVLGAPLWIPLVLVFLVLILVLFLLLWLAVFILGVLMLCFFVCGAAAIVPTVVYLAAGKIGPGLFTFFAGLALLGLGILMIPAVIYTAKGVAILCKKIVLGLKTLFVGRRKKS